MSMLSLAGTDFGVWVGRGGAYCPSVADTPAYYAPGIALCAHLQGEDLGGIEPGDG